MKPPICGSSASSVRVRSVTRSQIGNPYDCSGALDADARRLVQTVAEETPCEVPFNLVSFIDIACILQAPPSMIPENIRRDA